MTLNSYHIKRFIALRFLHLRRRIVSRLRDTPFYLYLYRSYWHSIIYKKNSRSGNETCYYTAMPHIGAGIGHQIANWNAGYWYAKEFGLKFTHSPFYSKKWDDFLGFGEDEIHVNFLLKKEHYKKRRLPLFSNKLEADINKKIIASYKGKKVIFVAEQDQIYHEQYGILEDIKYKFHNAKARQNDKLIYAKDNFNVAVHIRRGDIMSGDKVNPEYEMRFQNNSYYKNVLNCIINEVKISKPIQIYLFSQGEESDFPEFKNFNNTLFCFDMNQYDSFLHLVNADLLLTSKSGFSYIPALISNGIKICPENFWHSYPTSDDWILADEQGHFNLHKLQSII